MASRKQTATERRRFITRKTDPDVPAFLPDVHQSEIALKTRDRDIERWSRLPTRLTTSVTTGNELTGPSRGYTNIGEDAPRASAFVRVTPKLIREPPLTISQSTVWRSADDISASGQQQQTTINSDRLSRQDPVWSPPSARRQATCDRARGNRNEIDSIKPRRMRPVVTTCTPDIVRSAIGFKPIRQDSAGDSESSTSANGGYADSGSGYEQSTVRKNTAFKAPSSTSKETQAFQTALESPKASRRSREAAAFGGDSSELVRPKPWTASSTAQPASSSQWQPTPTRQQQHRQQQLQPEVMTPARLACHRVSASSGGSASSYDNVDQRLTPPHQSSSTATRRLNVPDTQSERSDRLSGRPPLSSFSVAPPIAVAVAAVAEAKRRRRQAEEITSPETTKIDVRQRVEQLPAASVAPHRLPRANTWVSPTTESEQRRRSDEAGSNVNTERRSSLVGPTGNTFHTPSATFSTMGSPGGSAIAAWRLQTGNGGFVGSSTSGHSRVVAPHMLGVYDPPKDTISRLRVVSSDVVQAVTDHPAAREVEFNVPLLPAVEYMVSSLAETTKSTSVLKHELHSARKESPPVVLGPLQVTLDTSRDKDEGVEDKGVAGEVAQGDGCRYRDDDSVEHSDTSDEELQPSCTESSEEQVMAAENIPNDDEEVQSDQSVSDEADRRSKDSREELDVSKSKVSSSSESDTQEDNNVDSENEETKADDDEPAPRSVPDDEDDPNHSNSEKNCDFDIDIVDREMSDSEDQSASSSSSPDEKIQISKASVVGVGSRQAEPLDAGRRINGTDTQASTRDAHEIRARVRVEKLQGHDEDSTSNDDSSVDEKFGGSKENIIGLMSLNKMVAECTAYGSIAEKVQKMASVGTGESAASGKRPGRLSDDFINRLLTGSSRTTATTDTAAKISRLPEIQSTSWTDDVTDNCQSITANQCVTKPDTLTANCINPDIHVTAASATDIKRVNLHENTSSVSVRQSTGPSSVQPVSAAAPLSPSGRTVGSVVEKFNVAGGPSKLENPGYSSTSHVIRSFVLPSKMKLASSGGNRSTSGGGSTVVSVGAKIPANTAAGDKSATSMQRSGCGSSTEKLATSGQEISVEAASNTGELCQSTTPTNNCKPNISNVASATAAVMPVTTKQQHQQQQQEETVKKIISEVSNCPTTSSSHNVNPSTDCLKMLETNKPEVQSVQSISSDSVVRTNAAVVAIRAIEDGDQKTVQTTVDTLVLCKPLLTKIIASSAVSRDVAPVSTASTSSQKALQTTDMVTGTTITSSSKSEPAVEKRKTTNDIPSTLNSPLMMSPTSVVDGSVVGAYSSIVPRTWNTSSSTCSVVDGEVAEQTTGKIDPVVTSPLTLPGNSENSNAAMVSSTVCVLARLSPAAPIAARVRHSNMTGAQKTAQQPTISADTKSSGSSNPLKVNTCCVSSPKMSVSSPTALVNSPITSTTSLRGFDVTTNGKPETPKTVHNQNISDQFPPIGTRVTNETETPSAFPFTSSLPWQPLQQTTVKTTESSAVKTREFPLDPCVGNLLSEGTNVMAALDDALAVLTSVVMETHGETSVAETRPNNNGLMHDSHEVVTDRNPTKRAVVVTKQAVDSTFPVRTSVPLIAQLLGDVPSRFVIGSSNSVVHQRLAPPDVVAGAAEAVRRRREIEAADNRRRRWHDSRGNPDEDSFNRLDPDDDSPQSTSPSLRQQLVTAKPIANQFPLPAESVILRHRRRLRKQRKERDAGGHVVRTTTKTSAEPEVVEDRSDATSGSSATSSDGDDQSTARSIRKQPARKSQRQSNARPQTPPKSMHTSARRHHQVYDKSYQWSLALSAPTSTKKLISSTTLDQLGRNTFIPGVTERPRQQRNPVPVDVVWKTPTSTPIRRRPGGTGATITVTSAKSRDVVENHRTITDISERPLIPSSANDCRQRIDYG